MRSFVIFAPLVLSWFVQGPLAPQCRTFFDPNTGDVTCDPYSNCSSVPFPGCAYEMRNTPLGLGVTCTCASKSPWDSVCCDMVVLPGGDSGTPVAMGICALDGFGAVWECPLFSDCKLYKGEGYPTVADCLYPTDDE